MNLNFKQLVELIVKNQQIKAFEKADKLIQQGLLSSPSHPVLLKLKAVSQFTQGQCEEAILTFENLVSSGVNDTETQLNLARCYLAINNSAGALHACNSALVNDNKSLAAWLFYFSKCAHSLSKQRLHESIDLALSLVPNDTKVLHAIVKSCLEAGEVDRAWLAWQRISSEDLLNNDLRLTMVQLLRASGKLQQALTVLNEIMSTGISSYSLHHTLANIYTDLREYEPAITQYKAAISANPKYAPSHRNLAELLFDLGRFDEMFTSYQQVLGASRPSAEVLEDYLALLLRGGSAEAVITEIEKYPHVLSTSVESFLKAESYRLTRNPEQQRKVLHLVEGKKLNREQCCQWIQSLITHNELAKAARETNALLSSKPDDQWALALKTTLDSIAGATNVEVFKQPIFESVINPPRHYSSVEEYCKDLGEYLKTLHVNNRAPLEQTLHKGTQTVGNLFNDEHPLVAHLESEFLRLSREALQQHQRHPELYEGFNDDGIISTSGSWSVLLKSGGYHSNHIHPMGWLSSVFYIALPSSVETSKQGWLTFGKANFDTPNENSHLVEIQPKIGKLVLFPSFYWHGTLPFEDKSRRMTVACDLVKSKRG